MCLTRILKIGLNHLGIILVALLFCAIARGQEVDQIGEVSTSKTTTSDGRNPPAALVSASGSLAATASSSNNITVNKTPDIGLFGRTGAAQPSRFAPDLSSGMVQYVVPISVASGRAGVVPNIALVYSSLDGNNVAGVGWAINVRSVERDTSPRLNYNESAFLLRDGHAAAKLVRTSASGDLEMYQPRVQESIFDLRRVSSATTSYWQRTQKNGLVEKFGETEESRIVTPKGTFAWLLSSTTDAYGKQIVYRYTVLNGETYLNLIAYGADPGASVPDNCQDSVNFDGCVQFSWQARNDVEITYERGIERIRAYRLGEINCYFKGTAYNTYRLSYESKSNPSGYSQASGRSLLASVTESGFAAGLGRVLASFSYNSQPTEWKQQTWPNNSEKPASFLRFNGDFDGDGRTDIAYVPEDGNRHWKLYFSNGREWKNGGTAYDWSPGPKGRWRNQFTFKFTMTVNGQLVTLIQKTWFMLMPIPWSGVASDFDGDGRTDIAYSAPMQGCQTQGWLEKIPLCTPDNWAMFFPNFPQGWKTGFWPHGPRVSTYNALIDLPNETERIPPEWYALTTLCRDGRFRDGSASGLACFDEDARVWRVGLSGTSDWTTSVWPGPMPKAGEAARDWMKRCQFADFNGDKLTDIACQDRDDPKLWQVGIYSSDQWVVSDWRVSPAINIDKNCLSGDINGDGLADIVCQNPAVNTGWVSILSNGNGFVREKALADGPSKRDVKFCGSGDINGDQKADLFCLTDNEGRFEVAFSNGVELTAKQHLRVEPASGETLIDKACNFGDFSGDGNLDALCYSNQTGKAFVGTAANPFPDTMTAVKDSLGSTLSLNYKSSSDFNNLSLPIPVKVLSSWKVTNDKNGNGLETHVQYSGGYLDNQTHEFLGFSSSKLTQGEKILESFYGASDSPPTFRNRSRLLRTLLSIPTERVEAIYDYFSSLGDAPPYFDPIKSIESRSSTCSSLGQCEAPAIHTLDFYQYDDEGNATGMLELRDDNTESLLALGDYAAVPTGGINFKLKVSGKQVSVPVSVSNDAAEIIANSNSNPSTYLSNLVSKAGASTLKAVEYKYDLPNACDPAPPKRASVTEVRELINEAKWAVSNVGYDQLGNVRCTSNPAQLKTSITYDDSGRDLIKVEPPTGLVSYFSYFSVNDASPGRGMPGQLKAFGQAGGPQTSFEYDRFGRTIKVQSTSGRMEEYSYIDNREAMTSTITQTNRPGGTVETTLNGAGLAVKVRSSAPEGKTTLTWIRRDEAGNPVEVTVPVFENSPASKSTTYEYDALDRVVSVTTPDGTKSSVCYFPDRIQFLDSTRLLRSYGTDSHRQIVNYSEFLTPMQSCKEKISGENAITKSKIVRDALERPVRLEDANQVTWALEYDGADRATRFRDATLNTVSFDYDAAGNLTRRSNPDGSSVSFEYNAANQITVQTQTLGKKTTSTKLRYDPRGRLMSVQNPDDSTTFEYDANDRLAGQTRSSKRFLWFKWKPEISFTHNETGEISSITYPKNGTYRYGYDNGLLTGIFSNDGSPLVKFSNFDVYGRWQAKEFSSGTKETRVFNERNWLEAMEVKHQDKVLLSLKYEYDSVGNPEKIIFNGNELTARYSLDNKLLETNLTGAPKNFDFNGSGSMTIGPAGNYQYPKDPTPSTHPHAPIATGSDPVQYDANGRIVSSLDRKFDFDVVGNLRSMKTDGRKLKLRDDGLGDFAKVDSGGLRSNYYFSGLYGCLKGKCSSAIYDNAEIVMEMDKDGEPLFIHRDVLGSVIGVSDSEGTLVWSSSYSAFGERTNDESSPLIFDSFAFGRKIAREDSVLRLGARSYDSKVGMFLQPDPISPAFAQVGNTNRYAYANNNPLRFIDPSGLYAGDFGYGGWGPYSGPSTFTTSTTSWTSGWGGNFGPRFMDFGSQSSFYFQSDLQVFQTQILEVNADRFQQFQMNPAEYLAKGRLAASVYGIPNVSAEDYTPWNINPPPFAALAEGTVVNNARSLHGGGLFAKYISFPLNVREGGTWDYKAHFRNEVSMNQLIATNAGNFNYGFVGASLGYSLSTLQMAAGLVNLSNLTRPAYRRGLGEGKYGIPLLSAPYGDDASDQYWIKRGYDFYRNNAEIIKLQINNPRP